MTLKLSWDGVESCVCQACNGAGKMKHEDFQRRDGRWVAGGGWIPCEACKGKKVVFSKDNARECGRRDGDALPVDGCGSVGQ